MSASVPQGAYGPRVLRGGLLAAVAGLLVALAACNKAQEERRAAEAERALAEQTARREAERGRTPAADDTDSGPAKVPAVTDGIVNEVGVAPASATRPPVRAEYYEQSSREQGETRRKGAAPADPAGPARANPLADGEPTPRPSGADKQSGGEKPQGGEGRDGGQGKGEGVAEAKPGADKAGDGKPEPPAKTPGPNAENYARVVDNPFKLVTRDPLSTFSAAVDTAAYSNVRRFLNDGQLPPKDAVRIEDFVNYFAYDYAGPKDNHPVAFAPELGPCPWNAKHLLLRVGVQARRIDPSQLPMRNFTFLIDVSGSMADENKLPLVKRSLGLLVGQLGAGDRVSIVTYAGDTSVRLEPTPGSSKDVIRGAIEALVSGGSTAGASGLRLAYQQAEKSFRRDGVNRVILATDGDFNVGVSSDAELVRLIEEKRKTGVFLTVLGYGMGNLKDAKLEQLAHHGNGHYAYIDSLDEAKKLFVEQGGALVTVAKDVKLQVEFNPAKVAGYRLIGYENRVLAAEDFRDDAKDAGDMGSGHTVTALYELVPAGEKVEVPGVDPLKYQKGLKPAAAADSDEWLTVKMRYKDPDADTSKEVQAAVRGQPAKAGSEDFRFAAATAGFGMVLRDSPYRGTATLESVRKLAEKAVGQDDGGRRAEFVRLVRKAEALTPAAPAKAARR